MTNRTRIEARTSTTSVADIWARPETQTFSESMTLETMRFWRSIVICATLAIGAVMVADYTAAHADTSSFETVALRGSIVG